MGLPRDAHGRETDIYAGLPQTEGGGLTPTSNIEQAGKIAHSLTQLTGRRRTFARWTVILLLTLPFVLFVVLAAVK
jgi:hypothetical protein